MRTTRVVLSQLIFLYQLRKVTSWYWMCVAFWLGVGEGVVVGVNKLGLGAGSAMLEGSLLEVNCNQEVPRVSLEGLEPQIHIVRRSDTSEPACRGASLNVRTISS